MSLFAYIGRRDCVLRPTDSDGTPPDGALEESRSASVSPDPTTAYCAGKEIDPETGRPPENENENAPAVWPCGAGVGCGTLKCCNDPNGPIPGIGGAVAAGVDVGVGTVPPPEDAPPPPQATSAAETAANPSKRKRVLTENSYGKGFE